MEALHAPGSPDPNVPVEARRARVAQLLARYVDDPEALAAVIEDAIAEGLSSDLDSATRRLLELEPDSERAIRMRVLVLVATLRHDEAIEMLARSIAARPDSRLLRELGDQVAPRLGQGANAGPSLAIVTPGHRPRGRLDALGGDFETEMMTPSPEPAPVVAPEPAWKGRADVVAQVLAHGETAAACEGYRRLLAADSDPALRVAVAEQLAAAGCHHELVRLIAPVYDVTRDGPEPGLYLADAYLALGARREGIALTNALSSVIPAAQATDLARRFARLSAS